MDATGQKYHLEEMLDKLHMSQRKRRLYAVNLANMVPHLPVEVRAGLDAVKRYADDPERNGLELENARRALGTLPEPVHQTYEFMFRPALLRMDTIKWYCARICDSIANNNPNFHMANVALCIGFNEHVPLPMIGNRTVSTIAQRIYEDESFEDTPILADALEDAGCIDEALIRHLRQRSHHRGCWAIDLLTGWKDTPMQSESPIKVRPEEAFTLIRIDDPMAEYHERTIVNGRTIYKSYPEFRRPTNQ